MGSEHPAYAPWGWQPVVVVVVVVAVLNG